MDKEKAYQILNQALAQINTSRNNHALLIEALNVLADKKEEPKKDD